MLSVALRITRSVIYRARVSNESVGYESVGYEVYRLRAYRLRVMPFAFEQRQRPSERPRTTSLAHFALFIFLFVLLLFRLALAGAGLLVLVARPVLVAFAFLALDRRTEAQIAAARVVRTEHRAFGIVARGGGGCGTLRFQRYQRLTMQIAQHFAASDVQSMRQRHTSEAIW